jgi:hypothetical protein
MGGYFQTAHPEERLSSARGARIEDASRRIGRRLARQARNFLTNGAPKTAGCEDIACPGRYYIRSQGEINRDSKAQINQRNRLSN